MPTRADLAHAVLLWTAISDQAKAEAAIARDALEGQALAEYERDGTVPTWRFPDLGNVPLATSTAQVVVEDAEKYMVWLLDRYPDEVVPSVRQAFDVALRAGAVGRGDPPCDPKTGEVIPGLKFVAGGAPRGVSVRPAAGVRARLLAEARTLLGLAVADDT